MKGSYKGRYDVSGLPGSEFEPGSQGRVLKNLLHIKKKREMDATEAQSLQLALYESMDLFGQSHRFTVRDLCAIHKMWLGEIYPWAGKYRQVNVSKGGFQFAAANRIPKLMARFKKDCLDKFTPCHFESLDKVIEALAITHTEFVLIHPFREGNGRLARLLSGLMALQAQLPFPDFTGIKGQLRQKYFRAVQAGIEKNYEPMKQFFKLVMNRKLRAVKTSQ